MKARKGGWDGEEGKRGLPPFPSSHRSLRACYFSIIAIFIGSPSGSLCRRESCLLGNLSKFVQEVNLRIMPHLDLKHKIVFQSIKPSIPEKLAFLCFHRDVLRQSIVQTQ